LSIQLNGIDIKRVNSCKYLVSRGNHR